MFIYSIFSGMFIGIYNAVICVAILDCVGEENIAQGFGFLVAFQGLFLSLGPPIAGNDHSIVSTVYRELAMSMQPRNWFTVPSEANYFIKPGFHWRHKQKKQNKA